MDRAVSFLNRSLGPWWTEFTCYLHLLVYRAVAIRYMLLEDGVAYSNANSLTPEILGASKKNS
jgi:hypothetical protein